MPRSQKRSSTPPEVHLESFRCKWCGREGQRVRTRGRKREYCSTTHRVMMFKARALLGMIAEIMGYEYRED